MCKEKCGSKCMGHWIMGGLLIIGGLNWGLVGIFNWDLVAAIFGDMSVVARIIYILVAVSALGILAGGCCCKKCKKGKCCKDGKCVDGVCTPKEDEGCADCAGGSCDMHGSDDAGEEA